VLKHEAGICPEHRRAYARWHCSRGVRSSNPRTDARTYVEPLTLICRPTFRIARRGAEKF